MNLLIWIYFFILIYSYTNKLHQMQFQKLKQLKLLDGFILLELDNKWYENKDYHTMYVSEIVKIYSNM